MVKPDIKHNYYADLDLPTTASLDEIRKAYRKLALQYHPDRNSGREDEVVPKFQAIQAASEVLCDPTVKDKYDNDRRRAGFFSSFTPRSGTPNNPYAANSPFPPPPRRTQTSTYQRPQTATAGPPPGAAANGADRFSNFPRPTSKKDPATQDRMNAFRAWQNMNNADRPRPTSWAQPPPQQPPSQARHKGRPHPFPGGEPRMPPDDPMRPGAKYKVPPPFDPDGANKKASAWASFQQANAGKPGMPTGNTFKTPGRQGFNPNTPGSDERPAPGGDRHHFTGYGDEDFLRTDMRGQPHSRNPSSGPQPTSPTSPRSRRPNPNPQRPFSGRVPDDQVPYAEGNRVRTPYSRSFYGEQTDLQRDGLRRSHSFRDQSKLSPEDGSRRARARSSSPHRPSPEQSHHRATFEAGGSSDESGADKTGTAEEMESFANQQRHRPDSAPTSDRPKKVPTGPSRRFANGSANGAQSDSEQPPNMYAKPPSSSSSPFSSQTWTSRMFGFDSTSRARSGDSKSRIPAWAIPSSVNPKLRSAKAVTPSRQRSGVPEYVTGADEVYINATLEERMAFLAFQAELSKGYGDVPGNLDMEVFLKLVAIRQRHETSGDALLDDILQRVLRNFGFERSSPEKLADELPFASRFSYTHNPELYKSSTAKSRSEENINTTFSPDGWTGEFTGEPDYFAPINDPIGNQPSPARRPTPRRNQSSQPRSATMDVPTPGGSSTTYEEVPQRPWGSDGTPSEFPRTAATDKGFDEEEWQRQFQDSTWSWPPPPPNPPSPGKGGRKQSQSRKGGKASARTETNPIPHSPVLGTENTADPDGLPKGETRINDTDAMDIDDTPPAHGSRLPAENGPDRRSGARDYAVPTSEWRQQQEHQQSHRKASSASRKAHRARTNHAATKFNANLDDLRHVEPLAPPSTTGEGLNVADMESALPFQSQASKTMSGDPLLPRDLQIPPRPKAPLEPQRLSKSSWQAHAMAFGEYVKEFHKYNTLLLQHFQERERQAQEQISKGMGWLEATGDTSGMITAPTGFGTYLRGTREDRRVREAWMAAWEVHTDNLVAFEKIRDRVRKLVVGGMLVDN